MTDFFVGPENINGFQGSVSRIEVYLIWGLFLLIWVTMYAIVLNS